MREVCERGDEAIWSLQGWAGARGISCLLFLFICMPIPFLVYEKVGAGGGWEFQYQSKWDERNFCFVGRESKIWVVG